MLIVNGSLVTTLRVPMISKVGPNSSTKLRIEVLDELGSKLISTDIDVKFIVNIKKPIVKVDIKPKVSFIGSSINVSLSIHNPNNITIKVTNVKVLANGSEIKVININENIKPHNDISKSFNLEFRHSGRYILKFLIGITFINKKLNVTLGPYVINVLNPIYLSSYSRVFNYGEDVKVDVAAFKPMENVFLSILKNGSVVKQVYVGDFDIPSCRSTVIMNLKPGNYSIVVIKNGLKLSNLLKISVVNNSKKVVSISKSNTRTTPSAGNVKVVLINNTVKPKGNVLLRVYVPTNELVRFKLYRYEPNYQPPWVLQPLLKTSRVSSKMYELVFKAPPKSGTYLYRLEVTSRNLNISRNFRLVVSAPSATTTAVPKLLLKNELLYPLLGTVALASLLLFRRYSKKR